MLNSNISSTSPHNMVNFGPLMAEIGWRVWGNPANFNQFRHALCSKSCVLLHWQHYSMALEQTASAKLCGMVQGMELVQTKKELCSYLHDRVQSGRQSNIDVYIYQSKCQFLHRLVNKVLRAACYECEW